MDKHVRGWKGASDHAPVWIELTDTDQANKGKDKLKKSASHVAPTVSAKKQTEPKGLANILEALPETAMPLAVKPMKAILVDKPFDEPGWIYEIKWDGYRAIATINDGSTTLVFRNNLVFDQFQPVNDVLASWSFNAVLDGEIVALND